ncbi:hypothetical protein DFH09DRAFT_1471058 [Mycena vulgaris]|nr:hypothetical protein DFH09DRAFT_1471058 [Mycena vulgaris]
MEGAGNPHHQRALDMFSGQPLDDGTSDDDERIRRVPEPGQYDDRRVTVRTDWSDEASAYSNSAEDEYPYPQSVIDMPSLPNPNPHINFQEPSRDSGFLGPGGPQLGFWDRLRGEGRPHVSWKQSGAAIIRYSFYMYGSSSTPPRGTDNQTVCFIAIIPLCKLLDYGGENLALYCGKDIDTHNKKKRDRGNTRHLSFGELPSTIVGVVLLRLLLVPACAFITGGARVAAQELHPHLSELNQTLLTTGVLTILLPAAFFAALNTKFRDDVRGDMLKVSRGLAVILLVVTSGLHEHKDAPAEFKEMVEKMGEKDPEVNPWACLILLVLTVTLMGVTAEFVGYLNFPAISAERSSSWLKAVRACDFTWGLVRRRVHPGIGLLRARSSQTLSGNLPSATPKTLAEARSIDLSIQFLMFWMPILVLLAWFTNKPLSLLFDMFEVVLLISATFLVNYVTADAKTNWAEGVMMLALYSMIALTAWFYPGQRAVNAMLSCTSVQEALSAHGVPPNSTFTNISFAGFHATLDDSQISNFTDHLRDLKRLYDTLKLVEQNQ